ncbi:hypothetical protein [Candidatus Villigracilis saccharophilus]|uniref:hypothetical protein n=1 Tax=Candidatus Villigracilis saccharophilus TaxID=3140684 RepID=UPI0031E729AE
MRRHAGCFSMALSSGLGKNGFTPTQIQTQAQVTLEVIDGKSRITKIHLTTEAVVPDIRDEKFQKSLPPQREAVLFPVALASTPDHIDRPPFIRVKEKFRQNIRSKDFGYFYFAISHLERITDDSRSIPICIFSA